MPPPRGFVAALLAALFVHASAVEFVLEG